MATEVTTNRFYSAILPLNFDRESSVEKKAYRKRVIDESLGFINDGYLRGSQSDYPLKSGTDLYNESEFADLHPYVEPPPSRGIWYVKELIVSLWLRLIDTLKAFIWTSPARVVVVPKDTLDAAEDGVRAGGNVLVLNFASPEEPGGGFDDGVGTQEEELCWRSDLSGMMYFIKKVEQLRNTERAWNLHIQTCYSPGVTVFRSSEKRSYSLLSEPFQVGILSCGAPDKPRLIRAGTSAVDYANWEVREKVRQLIYNQLHIAETKGYDTLILGAFGCGSFKNPPQVVAKLYKEVIDASFKETFRKIVFAVLEDPNRGPHNPEGNFKPFKDCFP